MNRKAFFVPYRGKNVRSDFIWLPRWGCYCAMSKNAAWYREYVEDTFWGVDVIGWGASFIPWDSLSTYEKFCLKLAWCCYHERDDLMMRLFVNGAMLGL